MRQMSQRTSDFIAECVISYSVQARSFDVSPNDMVRLMTGKAASFAPMMYEQPLMSVTTRAMCECSGRIFSDANFSVAVSIRKRKPVLFQTGDIR